MREFMEGRITVAVGDITREHTDAIVNAANSSLLGGGGVDGAIHRIGGHAILDACKQIRAERHPGGLPAGEAVITTGGSLAARHVIHTVGPVWFGGTHGEEKLLGDCYWNSLRLAAEHGCRTVAFPAISTDAYRFPRDRAAVIASTTVRDFLERNPVPDTVAFVFFSETDERIFLENARFG